MLDAPGKNCPAGSAVDVVGATAADCVACAPGYYAAKGYNVCLPCEAGTSQSASGASQCDACPTSQLRGMASCPSCTARSGAFAFSATLDFTGTTAADATYAAPSLVSAGCTLDNTAIWIAQITEDCSGEPPAACLSACRPALPCSCSARTLRVPPALLLAGCSTLCARPMLQ